MSPLDVLRDPKVSPAAAWEALSRLTKADVASWEPDTIALELQRRGLPPVASLMTKLLAAQTLKVSGAISRDYEALFAFALACDGITHGADEVAYPTPDQLAWAMHQIEAIAKEKITEENGFDPDEIDPAVAMLLLNEGWFLAPRELEFAQEILDRRTHTDKKLVERCRKAWGALEKASNMATIAEKLPEDAAGIQLRRLADAASYVREHAEHEAKLLSELALGST